jgi:hypothetical protein
MNTTAEVQIWPESAVGPENIDTATGPRPRVDVAVIAYAAIRAEHLTTPPRSSGRH